MIGRSQIGTTGTLIHDVEQEDSLLAVILELLQILGLLYRGAPNLQELDFVGCQGLGDFLHEVRELYEDEDTLIFRNLFPRVVVSMSVSDTAQM